MFLAHYADLHSPVASCSCYEQQGVLVWRVIAALPVITYIVIY
jgi:hypothetical protein